MKASEFIKQVKEQLDKTVSTDGLVMDAHYYSFEKTGNAAIDKILSAVACAGSAYHDTGDWNSEFKWAPHTGYSPVEWIQNAANEAAAAASAGTSPTLIRMLEVAMEGLSRIECESHGSTASNIARSKLDKISSIARGEK